MVERRIKEARFPAVKSRDSFDFLALPSLNKTLALELARSEYVLRRENVIAVGNSGTGKNHVALGLGPAAAGECQANCRLSYVMIPPIDEAAALAAEISVDANRRLVMSVPRCSLRSRSGARQPRLARARQGALRVAAGGSAP